jgi:hypothetical protein
VVKYKALSSNPSPPPKKNPQNYHSCDVLTHLPFPSMLIECLVHTQLGSRHRREEGHDGLHTSWTGT